MSNFYEYLYGRVMTADDAPQGIRKHPNGSPCTAKSDEPCPILRHEKRIDESDVLDPHLGEESKETEGNETAESPEGRARREYAEVVARYTNADGSKKRGWLKAPNGKDTNLDERQWVQVRTPSFKRWCVVACPGDGRLAPPARNGWAAGYSVAGDGAALRRAFFGTG